MSTNKQIIDPRAILGLLDGGDRLLDGSYQADYLETLSSENGDDDDEENIPALAKDQHEASNSLSYSRVRA